MEGCRRIDLLAINPADVAYGEFCQVSWRNYAVTRPNQDEFGSGRTRFDGAGVLDDVGLNKVVLRGSDSSR